MPEEVKPPTDPPLVDVKVTNPVTYIKRWWQKVIGNEGIDFSFRVRPLTALLIAIVVTSIAFGVGRFVLPFTIPFFKVDELKRVVPNPSPTPEVWKETAYTGNLQFSTNTGKYYLVTTSSEAITLSVPSNIDLSGLVGKRIFAAGNYNKSSRILVVSDAKNMEVLPKKPEPIPTLEPSPFPSFSPGPYVSPTPLPIESPESS